MRKIYLRVIAKTHKEMARQVVLIGKFLRWIDGILINITLKFGKFVIRELKK